MGNPRFSTNVLNHTYIVLLLVTWGKCLHWAEFWYNTSPHFAPKMTPFGVLYGRDPPQIIRLGKGHTPLDSLEEMWEREAITVELRYILIQTQQSMKKNGDLK